MAISTLSKFTVPLSNDQSAASQGLLMPKLQYRFRLILENFGVSTPRSELTKQVMDVTRPSLTFDTVTLDVYNSKVYMAGKHICGSVQRRSAVECTNVTDTLKNFPLRRSGPLTAAQGPLAAKPGETLSLPRTISVFSCKELYTGTLKTLSHLFWDSVKSVC